MGEFFNQPEYRCDHKEWPFLFACTGCSQTTKIEEQTWFSSLAALVLPELRGGLGLWRIHTKRDDPHYDEAKTVYTVYPRIPPPAEFFAEFATRIVPQYDQHGNVKPIRAENVTSEFFEYEFPRSS